MLIQYTIGRLISILQKPNKAKKKIIEQKNRTKKTKEKLKFVYFDRFKERENKRDGCSKGVSFSYSRNLVYTKVRPRQVFIRIM